MKRKTIFTTLIIAIVLFASLQTVMALPQCPNLGRTLSLGMRGQDVSQLQIYLNSYLGLGLNTQGIFGNLTKKAVQTFQRQQNIRPVNGIVGTVTKNAIASNCSNEGVFCTQDARQCPNGKWVGRTGPNCQFVCN